MSSVAISLFVFGIYLVVSGLGFTFAPDFCLGLFGQPPATEPWIHISGTMLMVVGYFYIQVGRADLRPFYMWSVYARLATFVLFLLFVVLQWAPTTLAMFAVIDLLGALWTYLTLKKST